MGDKKKMKTKNSKKSQRKKLALNDTSSNDSMSTTSKKRRSMSGNTSSFESIDDVEESNASRGRPPRPPSSAGLKSSAVNSSARRSKRRTFAVDPSKPLQILRPSDDLKSRFGLGTKEYSELMATLNEDPSDDPFAVRFDDLSSGSAPKSPQMVFTPRVSVSNNSSSFNDSGCNGHNDNSQIATPTVVGEHVTSGGKQKDMRLQDQSQTPSSAVKRGSKTRTRNFAAPNFKLVKRGSRYVEYDIDSGDEDFLEVTLPAALKSQDDDGNNNNNNRIISISTGAGKSSSGNGDSGDKGNKKLCQKCKYPNGKYNKKGIRDPTVVRQCVTKSCINYTKDNEAPSSSFPTVINADIFEKMISILERELEVAKIFLKERIRADLQGLVTKNLIDDGYSSLVLVNEYLNPSISHGSRNEKTTSTPSSSSRIRALASLEKAYDHSRGEDACLSRKASTSSIVSAAVAAASATANGDINAPDKMEDILSTLSCPAPLAVLLSTVPRNSPRDTTHTSVEAAAVFTSTLNRSASQSSIASLQSNDVDHFQSLSNKRNRAGNLSPRSNGRCSPRGSPRHDDTQTNSQYFTSEHLRELVPEERVIHVLARVFRFNLCPDSDTSNRAEGSQEVEVDTSTVRSRRASGGTDSIIDNKIPSKHTPADAASQELDPSLRLMLSEVYKYWIEKRSYHLDSLLRCYHNFMMDEWHQAPSMPPLPEDFNTSQLLKGHKELHRLRFDLDRARLIVDRVRRRERIKKDLIKLSSDNFDKVLNTIQQTMDCPETVPTTVKTKGARHGNKKEIDRCKIVSTLPDMLKKRLFSLHPESSQDIPESDSVDDMNDESDDNGEDDMDSEFEEEEDATTHVSKKSRKEDSVVYPSTTKAGSVAITNSERDDVVVVSTGDQSPQSSSPLSDSNLHSTAPAAPLSTTSRQQDTSSSTFSSSNGPPSSRRRSTTILAGRRISRASDEVNVKISDYNSHGKKNTDQPSTSSSTSNEIHGEHNSLETSSTTSTTTSSSTNVRVPNGGRSSRGMVSIPKLKKGVADQNSIRGLSSSPIVLSENQKWSNLAVKTAMKKVVIIPEVVPARKPRLRSVSAPASSRAKSLSFAKRNVTPRKTKKALSVSSEEDTSSSSSEDSEDESSSDEESDMESSPSPPPKRRATVKPTKELVADSDSESDSQSDSDTDTDTDSDDDDDDEDEDEEEEKFVNRSSPRLVNSTVRASRSNGHTPARNTQKSTPPRVQSASASRHARQIPPSKKRAIEHKKGRQLRSSPRRPQKKGNRDEDDSTESDSGGGSGSSDDSGSENESDASRSSTTSSASASSSSSSVLSDPPGGFGSRVAKRGTYSPALCSLSGLARPFMSGGSFSSFKACFS